MAKKQRHFPGLLYIDLRMIRTRLINFPLLNHFVSRIIRLSTFTTFLTSRPTISNANSYPSIRRVLIYEAYKNVFQVSYVDKYSDINMMNKDQDRIHKILFTHTNKRSHWCKEKIRRRGWRSRRSRNWHCT